MAEVVETTTAVARAIDDGDCVYLAGFSHLVPTAVGHEMIRQEVTDLDLVRLAPDPIYDQLIAAGCVATATFSWAGNPGIGNLGAFRRAVEDGVPRKIAVEEYTHFGLLSRLVAAARGYPFLPLRTFVGSDLLAHRDDVRPVDEPFGDDGGGDDDGGGEPGSIPVVPPLAPDVAVVHAQRADTEGNARAWGIIGDLREAVFAAEKVVLSVEEIVDEDTLSADDRGTFLPGREIDYLVEAPFGSHPSYAHGYYGRDADAYAEWNTRSREHSAVDEWLDEWVHGVADRREYCAKLGDERLAALRSSVGGERSRNSTPPGSTGSTGAAGGTDAGHSTMPASGEGSREPTGTELMVASAARELTDEDTVLVGVGLPILACLLAKRTHAPEMTMLYESGAIEADPRTLPYSTAGPGVATSARDIVPMYDVFTNYLQAGRLDVGFLGGAQVDRWGNVNSTVIGEYDSPKVRLPGSGGACEIASNTDRTIIVTPHQRRRFPEKVDFITSPGYVGGREGRSEKGLRGGPDVVVTDKACMRFDARGELYVDALHPGVTRTEVQETTGWDLAFASDVGETPRPAPEAIRLLREDLDPERRYL